MGGSSIQAGPEPFEEVGEPVLSAPAKSPYRWVILTLCFIVMTTSFTVRIAWSNAATKVGSDLGLDPTMLGSFVTAFFVGYVITNAIGGFAADRFGAKRMVTWSLLPLAACVAGFGLMRDYPVGLLIQLAMGLSAGIDYAATTKLAAAWFPSEERGRCFGVLSAASSTALIFCNALFPRFIEATSWHTLYYCLGGGTLVIAVLCAVTLREAPVQAGATAVRTSEPVMTTIRSLVRDRDYMFLAFAGFGALWATWGVTFWGNALMVKGHGLSNIAAGEITTLLGIGGLIAKPTYGFLSDLIAVRRKLMLMPCFLLFALMLLVFGSASTEAEFRLLAPFLGVFAFIYGPLTNALLTDIIGTRDVGAASGLMNAFGQAGTIIAPVAIGYVFQVTHSFLGAFATLALGPLLAAVCIMLINEAPRRARRA